MFKAFIIFFLFCSIFTSSSYAQLSDLNNDGEVRILAFGDSVTFGVGDGTSIGEFSAFPPVTDGSMGYPARVENILGVFVDNEGVPGEEVAMGGAERYVSLVQSSSADYFLIKEGTNDSIRILDRSVYSSIMQSLINVTRAMGREPILLTIPNSCCDRDGRQPITDGYSEEIITLGFINDVAVADVDRAWETTCIDQEECELYNIPDGIHPNTVGYDVMAQTVLSALLGIDIFQQDGAGLLEQALGLETGTVLVQPSLETAEENLAGILSRDSE